MLQAITTFMTPTTSMSCRILVGSVVCMTLLHATTSVTSTTLYELSDLHELYERHDFLEPRKLVPARRPRPRP